MNRDGLRPLRVSKGKEEPVQNLAKQPHPRTVWPWQDDLSQDGPRFPCQRGSNRKVKWSLPAADEDDVQEPAKRRKVLNEEVAQGKQRWDEKDKRFLFCFKLADGKSVSFQTTSKAAGSREAAERIGHRCHEKFKTRASKQEVTSYRDELYQEEARAAARVKLEASKVELKVERGHELQSSAVPFHREDCKGWGAHVFWCFVAATSAGLVHVPTRQCHPVLPHKVIAKAFRGAKNVLGEGTGWEAHLRELELATAGPDSRLRLQDVAELLAHFQETVVEEYAPHSQAAKQDIQTFVSMAVHPQAVNGKDRNDKASKEAARKAKVKVELDAAKAGADSDRRSGRKAAKDKNDKAVSAPLAGWRRCRSFFGLPMSPRKPSFTMSFASMGQASQEAANKANMKAEVDGAMGTVDSHRRAGKASKEAACKAKVKAGADVIWSSLTQRKLVLTPTGDLDARLTERWALLIHTGELARGLHMFTWKWSNSSMGQASKEAACKANVKAGADVIWSSLTQRQVVNPTGDLDARLGLRHAVGDRVWCSGYGPRWPAKVEMISFDGAEDTEPYCVSFYGEKTKAWVSEAKLMFWGSIKPSRPAKRWQRRFDVAVAAAEGSGK
ncbi:unnamed protein product [Symbiodinium sp. CCMP2456]|nr:unnamed protein product [Symbiodinium sp. CCMP2456]